MEIFLIEGKIKRYKICWLEQFHSMIPGRILKPTCIYIPKGWRDLGEPHRYWEAEAGTGSTPSLWSEDSELCWKLREYQLLIAGGCEMIMVEN